MRVGAKSKFLRTGQLVRYCVLAVAAAVATALLPGPASAAPVIYFGEDPNTLPLDTPLTSFPNASAAQADFLSQITNPGIEHFEGFSDGAKAVLELDFIGVTTARLLGKGQILEVAPDDTRSGRYNTTDIGDAEFGFYWDTDQSFSIELGTPVAAFGFFGTDIGDFDGQAFITLSLEGTNRAAIDLREQKIIPDISTASVLFWGIIDNGLLFDKIVFSTVQPSGASATSTDFFGFDDMIVAAPEQISEPASLAIFGLGLAGIGFLRRRGNRRGKLRRTA